jgi:hypothetical protein
MFFKSLTFSLIWCFQIENIGLIFYFKINSKTLIKILKIDKNLIYNKVWNGLASIFNTNFYYIILKCEQFFWNLGRGVILLTPSPPVYIYAKIPDAPYFCTSIREMRLTLINSTLTLSYKMTLILFFLFQLNDFGQCN